MAFYPLISQCRINRQSKKGRWYIFEETEEKQNSVTTMMSAETVLPVRLKLEGESFAKNFSMFLTR